MLHRRDPHPLPGRVLGGPTLTAATTLVEADAKRMRLYTELFATGSRRRPASPSTSTWTPRPADRSPARRPPGRVDAVLAAHAGLPAPRTSASGSEATDDERAVTPYEGRPAAWVDAAVMPAPLRLHRRPLRRGSTTTAT